jgi:hypothetical protein
MHYDEPRRQRDTFLSFVYDPTFVDRMEYTTKQKFCQYFAHVFYGILMFSCPDSDGGQGKGRRSAFAQETGL